MAKKIEIKCSAGAMLDIAKLSNFQGDLKEISPENLGKLKNRISRLGFDAPIFIWKGHNKILDGHQRLRALREMISDGYFLENNLVPINEIEAKNEKEAKERLLGYVSQFGKINGPGLYNFLEDIDDIGLLLDDLDLPDFDMDAFQNEFFGSEKEGLTEDDAIPEEDEIKRRAKLGDLWELGKHRLFCGDATDLASYEILMGDEKASMVFTDPPYDLEIDKIYEAFDSAAIYSNFQIWMGSDKQQVQLASRYFDIFGHFFIHDFKAATMISGGMPMSQHNIIAKFGSKKMKNLGDGFSTILRIATLRGTIEHKIFRMGKRVSLPYEFITHYSDTDEIVLDAFGGTGSTLIACEKAIRRARIIELNPQYCDMILQRWEDFTGDQAVLMEDAN